MAEKRARAKICGRISQKGRRLVSQGKAYDLEFEEGKNPQIEDGETACAIGFLDEEKNTLLVELLKRAPQLDLELHGLALEIKKKALSA